MRRLQRLTRPARDWKNDAAGRYRLFAVRKGRMAERGIRVGSSEGVIIIVFFFSVQVCRCNLAILLGEARFAERGLTGRAESAARRSF